MTVVTTQLHHHTDPRTVWIQQTLGVRHAAVVVFYKPSVCNPIQRTLVDHHASTALRATGQIRTTLPNTAILAVVAAVVAAVAVAAVAAVAVMAAEEVTAEEVTAVAVMHVAEVPMRSCSLCREVVIVCSWLSLHVGKSQPSVECGIGLTQMHGLQPAESGMRRVVHVMGTSTVQAFESCRSPTGMAPGPPTLWDKLLQTPDGLPDQATQRQLEVSG
jgi:hypothetical protein